MSSIPASRHLHAEQALLPDGWHRNVAVDIGAGGCITAVHTPAKRGTATARCRFLLPAMSNAHSHSFQRALAGLLEIRAGDRADDFWSWRQQMYRLVARLEPDDIEAIARMAFLEMLQAGFTAVGEFHYLHHQPDGRPYADHAELSARIMAAAADTGIGLCLLPVLYAQADVDGRRLEQAQLRFGNDLERYLRLVERARTLMQKHLPEDARLGLAPHSLRAVGPAQLGELLAADTARVGPLHMHAAEQQREVEAVQQHLGQTPVAWLVQHAGIDRRWCLIHATHMQPGELSALARSGAVVAVCPQTEANLGDGIFKARDWLHENGGLAIGSDANLDISVRQELRLLDYSQRLASRRRLMLADRSGSQGEQLYLHCVAGGAQALDRPSGRIEPGCLADLVHLDPAGTALANLDRDHLLDGWIFAAGGGMVRDVWSAGRHCVIDGLHPGQDTIVRQYAKTMEKLARAY